MRDSVENIESKTSHTSLKGHWFVLAAAVLWGTTGTAQALAPAGYHPVVIGTLRLAIGGMAQLIFALVHGVLNTGVPWPIGFTTLAAVGVAAYQLCFFAAVAKTGVAVGTMITIGSSPIFGGLLGFLIRKESPGSKWAVATILAIIGCSLLIGAGGDITLDLTGVLLALGAGASYALYAVTSKGLLEHHAPDAVMAVVFCAGTLMLSPVFFLIDPDWLLQTRSLIVVLHLGVIATALPYSLFARGLKTIPAATAVTFNLAEPLTASLLGIVLLGERLTRQDIMGIGLILCGLALLSYQNDSDKCVIHCKQ